MRDEKEGKKEVVDFLKEILLAAELHNRINVLDELEKDALEDEPKKKNLIVVNKDMILGFKDFMEDIRGYHSLKVADMALFNTTEKFVNELLEEGVDIEDVEKS